MYPCKIPGGKSIIIKWEIAASAIHTPIALTKLNLKLALAIFDKNINTNKPIDI